MSSNSAIRIACAWLLLLLAASPFTAPYATCDLSLLIGQPVRQQIVQLGASIQHVAARVDQDAFSISPVTARVQFTPKPAAVMVPVRSDTFSPIPLDRSPRHTQPEQQ